MDRSLSPDASPDGLGRRAASAVLDDGSMTDDFAWLDATAQAELVARGDASPAELVDAAIARIESLNPAVNAVIHERFDRSSRSNAGDVARRTAAGRAVPRQGRRVPHRRRPVPLRDAPAEATPVDRTGRHVARGALSRRRSRLRRQDQHARARDERDHRTHRLRADAQPVGPLALDRRLEWRLRGRGRGGHGAGRARQRHGRLDPIPRFDVRHRRAEADARANDARARLRRVLGSAHPRARADALGARHRRGARRDRRTRRPEIRTARRRPPGRSATRSARRPAGSASACARDAATASRRTPSVNERSTTRGGSSNRWAITSRSSTCRRSTSPSTARSGS